MGTTRRLCPSLVAASLGCSILLAWTPEYAAAAKPNVLLIAIDDLNDWVGCLAGHPQIRTPHIDRLAKRGVLFSNAHCQAPICNPSRASFFSGVLPSNSGVYDNDQMFRNAPRLKDLRTMPQHFRDHGYVAWGVGKLYHGNTRDPQSWTEDGGRRRTRRPPKGVANLSGIPGIRIRDFGPIDMTDQQMGDMIATQWAAGKLAESHDKPFFLALGITLPHVPLYAPRSYFQKYPVTQVKLPPVLGNDRDDLPPPAIKLTESMYNTPLNQKSIVETGDRGNHAVRSEYWRYIRYADGSEELYDHRNDPNEWRNLASLPGHSDVISRHARWLPKHDEPDAPRSKPRRGSVNIESRSSQND